MANALNMMDFSPSRENPPASACSMSKLPPEIEEGNIEYKLKLVNPSASRFEHLVTQMKWRLREGQGEAIYEIGVEDNGLLVGLTEEELQASLTTVQMMADKLDATITILRQREVDYDLEEGEPPRKACELLVRRVPDDQQFIDLRVAVLGNVDVGKSTLLGVLTQGELDNGRGRARLNLFRHLHEIQSGRTSSISHEILGFSGTGEVINYSDSQQGCLTAEEICESASKLLTLIDLAGHHKYLKTTISGLTGYSPDFAMLVVSANTGVAGTTREHLGLALALQVPIFVVVSKIDLCPEMITTRTVTQLHRLLTGCRKVPFEIKSDDDAVTAARTFNESSVCPIFLASSVTGQNLDRIKKFLHVLPPSHNSVEQDKLAQELTEYQVDEVYSVPDVGKVVSGTLFRGTVKEHDRLLLGPDECGFFHPVEVHSIHRNRSPCRVVRPGQAATLAVGEWDDRIMLRKGMVLVNKELHPTSCMEFEAEVCVLFHTTMICKGFQATLHIGNVCQTAVLTEMNIPCMKTNEQAQVRFRFIKNPEYLREGSRLLLREGSTKVLGKVTKVYTYSPVDR